MTWCYLGLITHVLYIHFSLMFSGEPMLLLGYTFTKWYFTFVRRLYLYRTFITVSCGFYLQIISRSIHVDVTLVFVNIVGAFRLMRDRVIINFITLVEDLLPPLNSRKSFHLKKKCLAIHQKCHRLPGWIFFKIIYLGDLWHLFPISGFPFWRKKLQIERNTNIDFKVYIFLITL